MKYLKPRRGPVSLYQLEGPFNYNDPVHENLCLAALYQVRDLLGLTDANFGSLWSDPKLNEFLRGVFWNDDPAVLMFDLDHPDSDHDFSSGYEWKSQFDDAEDASSNDKKNLTGRSHFWDMQFLHGMACVSSEPASLTRYRALMWAEFMYKVAIGESVSASDSGSISSPDAVAATLLGQVVIPANPLAYDSNGAITEGIRDYFGPDTRPADSKSIAHLLNRKDEYKHIDTGKRAIGSVMHLIQDSFARGHTRRVLENPQDVVTNTATAITFEPGTYGDWGAVATFHSYKGQNDDQHTDFDEDTSSVSLDPTNLGTFNQIVGGRNAIDYCQRLLTYYHNQTPWTDGPQALLETVFALDGHATPSDTAVNPSRYANLVPIPAVKSTGLAEIGAVDPSYFTIQDHQTAPAYVVAKDPNWVTPDGARWISPSTNTQGAANATWAYRLELSVPASVDPSTVMIVGRLAADDYCIGINLNDEPAVTRSSTPPRSPDYTALAGFSLTGFRSGYNYIDFFVNNIGGPTGLVVIIDSASAFLNQD